MTKSDVAIYSASGIELSLPLDRERETVWATQAQIEELFGVDQSGVSRHIRNLLRDGELDEKSNMQKMHIANSDRPVTLYSLDVILAIGYRANSGRAIAFRRWATEVLKRYLVDGAALNDWRLEQLESIVRILNRSTDELVAGVADVLTRYMPSLHLLQEYDNGHVQLQPGSAPGWRLTIDEARTVIGSIGGAFPADHLFGRERDHGLESVIAAIYQGFGGHEIYPTVEEKAANLLYLVVKDHPLSDGNKRSAAALFVMFLSRNGLLELPDGQPRISNNALAAITLMVAMSNPLEKALMIALIMRMIEDGGPG